MLIQTGFQTRLVRPLRLLSSLPQCRLFRIGATEYRGTRFRDDFRTIRMRLLKLHSITLLPVGQSENKLKRMIRSDLSRERPETAAEQRRRR